MTLVKPHLDVEFPDYTEIILRAIDQPMKIRDGVHGVQITDLTLCPRLKIFEIVNPKEQSSTMNPSL